MTGAQAPTSNVSAAEYSGPDSALANYLQYYSTLEKPGYAVLVTGSWGVGKSHQVKQIIPESQRYYVSLYGLDSVNSIHDAVLASCLPSMKLGGALSTVGEVGKAMGDGFAVAGFANSVWNVYLRQRLKPDRTIVFDDLERSSLWAAQKSELLGAVNHYAEHLGFRVVVICHDERIADELAELKEKTFGHTVQVAPQTDAAVEAFIRDLGNETAKEFVTTYWPLIEQVWAQSGQSSLRILKHVINDIARLRSVLAPKHLESHDAIVHVLRFFSALDIEVRAGNMSRDLLLNRMRRQIDEAMHRNVPAVDKVLTRISNRYPTCDIGGTILSDEIVEATLIEGRFDAESIAAWLDQTPYFIQASDADPWRIVMHFDELDDADVAKGVTRMQAQFDDRSVTNIGEFLHIASLRLMMAEQNVSGRSMEDEVELCLAYVDDLLKLGKLPAKPLIPTPFDRIYDAYDGFSFWVSDASRPHFRSICEYVEQARQQALEASYPEIASELLHNLENDAASIFATISITNTGQGALANVPILLHIPVRAFVDAWLSGSPSGWRKIAMALDNRYDFRKLEGDLRDERPWLVELKKELQNRINAATGLAEFRLRRIKPKVFDALEIADENE